MVPLSFEQSARAEVTVLAPDASITGSIAGTQLSGSSLGTGYSLDAILDHPSDGSLTVSNSGSIDASVGVAVFIESSLHLTIGPLPASVAPGMPVTVALTLTEPVSDAVVTADIINANGTTAPISLTPDGTGNWTGQVVPTGPGKNIISARATGGRPRFARADFDVANGNLAVGAGFTERLDDPDQDGLANTLVVSPTITASVAGTFLINARLLDASGDSVAAVSGKVAIAAGSHPIDLSFDGTSINRSGRNGPYRVVDLNVIAQDASGSVVQIDIPDLGQTQTYASAQFQH